MSEKQKIEVMGKALSTANSINPIDSMEVLNLMKRMREAIIDNQLKAKGMELTIDSETISNVIQIMNMPKYAKNNK